MYQPSAKKFLIWTAAVLGLGIGAVGCNSKSGDGNDAGTDGATTGKSGSTAESKTTGARKSGLPLVSIKGKKQVPKKRKKIAPPKQGTPQWYVHQMLLLRLAKYPATNDVQKLRALRRDRNLKIIKLAEEAIALTNKDKKLQEVFTASVHQLIDARVTLALQGKEEDMISLYDLADVLFKRDKTSKSAAEAAYKVAAFANTNALRYPDPKTGWLKEFVRRARLFATDFPQEKTRAVWLLDVAGRSCEANGKVADAITCYEQLRKQFPKMSQAQYATAVLRRLRMPGRPPELAGQTLDGGFYDIKDFKGKTVLVAFWATDNKACRDVIPKLKAIGERYKRHGLEIVGVSLEKEEPVLDDFLVKAKIGWPQIFYTNRKKRRWDNPVVKYYAIRELPTLWLVNSNGIVAETNIDPAKLNQKIQALLRQRRLSRR